MRDTPWSIAELAALHVIARNGPPRLAGIFHITRSVESGDRGQAREAGEGAYEKRRIIMVVIEQGSNRGSGWHRERRTDA